MDKFLNKRYWRHLAIQILPEFIKGPIRSRLQGYRPLGTSLSIAITDTGEVLEALIAKSIRLRIPRQLAADFHLYFADNAEYAEEMAGFVKEARKGGLLFDVGASHGIFSALYCASSPGNKVIAFEPSPSWKPLFEPLMAVNDLAERVQLVPVAIGNDNGDLELYLDRTTGFVQIVESPQESERIIAPVRTIDDICRELSLTPDLIKMDVEGYELEALQGARHLLGTRKPAICLELHLNYLEDRKIKPREILDLLQSFDYSLYSCLDEKLSSRDIYDSIKPVYRFVAR